MRTPPGPPGPPRPRGPPGAAAPLPIRVRVQIAGNSLVWLLLPQNASCMSQVVSHIRTTFNLPPTAAYTVYLNDALFLLSESTSLLREGDTIHLRSPDHPDLLLPQLSSSCRPGPAAIAQSFSAVPPSNTCAGYALSAGCRAPSTDVTAAPFVAPISSPLNRPHAASRTLSDRQTIASPGVDGALPLQTSASPPEANDIGGNRGGKVCPSEVEKNQLREHVVKRVGTTLGEARGAGLRTEGDCLYHRNDGEIADGDRSGKHRVMGNIRIEARSSRGRAQDAVVIGGRAGPEAQGRTNSDLIVTVGKKGALLPHCAGLQVEVMNRREAESRGKRPDHEPCSGMHEEGPVGGRTFTPLYGDSATAHMPHEKTGSCNLSDGPRNNLLRPIFPQSKSPLIATPTLNYSNNFHYSIFECWRHLRIEFPPGGGGSLVTPLCYEKTTIPLCTKAPIRSVTPTVLGQTGQKAEKGMCASDIAPLRSSSQKETSKVAHKEADNPTAPAEIGIMTSPPCDRKGTITGKRTSGEVVQGTVAPVFGSASAKKSKASRLQGNETAQGDEPEDAQPRKNRKRVLTAIAKRRRNARNRKREKRKRLEARQTGMANIAKNRGPENGSKKVIGKAGNVTTAAKIASTSQRPGRQDREDCTLNNGVVAIFEPRETGKEEPEVSEVLKTNDALSGREAFTLDKPPEEHAEATVVRDNTLETEQNEIEVQAMAKLRELLSTPNSKPCSLDPSNEMQENQTSDKKGKGKSKSFSTSLGSVSAFLLRARTEGLLESDPKDKKSRPNESSPRGTKDPRVDGKDKSRISKKKRKSIGRDKQNRSRKSFYLNEAQRNESIFLGFEEDVTDAPNFEDSGEMGNGCRASDEANDEGIGVLNEATQRPDSQEQNHRSNQYAAKKVSLGGESPDVASIAEYEGQSGGEETYGKGKGLTSVQVAVPEPSPGQTCANAENDIAQSHLEEGKPKVAGDDHNTNGAEKTNEVETNPLRSRVFQNLQLNTNEAEKKNEGQTNP